MNGRVLAIASAAVIALSACSPSSSGLFGSARPSGGSSPGSSPGASGSGSPEPTLALTKVSVVIAPVTNAEFAGYVAAEALGYYADEGLDVEVVNPPPAGVITIGPGGPEFMIVDVAEALAGREHGSDMVDIAQIFQRSGNGILTWKSDGFESACDLGGEKVGLWPVPEDLEATARLAACPLTPSDYNRVEQGHDVAGLLDKSVDALEVRLFDEYAQVLEATNPKTKAQYGAGDLTFFSADTDKTATLKDAIFARAGWLAETGNRETAVAFVTAAIRGWVYCRDHQDDCVQFVTRANPALGTSHQRWMLNEVNALIWPSPSGIGVVDPALWEQTVTVALGGGVITARPAAEAADATIVTDANESLGDLDLLATDFLKGHVGVAPGGK
jgi:NitT/TauT family transport system substrate-binding protein